MNKKMMPVVPVWALCSMWAVGCTAPVEVEREYSPRAEEAWQDAELRTQAEFLADPLMERFQRVFGTRSASVPVMSANEAAPIDSVIVEWPCSNRTTPDVWDEMWMAMIGESLRSGAGAWVYLTSASSGFSDAETLANCTAMLEATEAVDASLAEWIQGVPTDAFWMRDFGPQIVRNRMDSSLVVEDPLYYPGRDLDDAMPADFALRVEAPHSDFPLHFEGGNILPNGGGICVVSDIIYGANPQYTEAEIRTMFATDLGCDELVVVEALQDYATGHVDMWLAWADRTALLVGEYTESQDAVNRGIIESNVASLLSNLSDPETGEAIDIVRMPMPSNCPKKRGRKATTAPDSCSRVALRDRNWRTYLNVLPVNGTILLPVYAEHEVYEDEAASIWEAQGYAVRRVSSDHISPLAGSIHCISKSVDSAW
ncbi:MAG: agmatine deiminase family protein [Proteobacteria bacterium]|nr:agmatine deiminase family protein [Pseudomonadota bacterium]